MLSKKDIIVINRQFSDGRIVNSSSLDFALDHISRSKNWLRSAAMLTRAILIDHVFEEGNKRTAAAVMATLMEMNNVEFDRHLLDKAVATILLKNITDIRKIERVINYARK